MCSCMCVFSMDRQIQRNYLTDRSTLAHFLFKALDVDGLTTTESNIFSCVAFPALFLLFKVGTMSTTLTESTTEEGVRRKEIWKLLGNIGLFCAYLAFVACFFCTYEGWSLSDSIMFSLVTMTTIGKLHIFRNVRVKFSDQFDIAVRLWIPDAV